MSAPPGAPPVSVLFVCLGNICRSPAAHAVAETLRAGRGFARFDSAGTGQYHAGELPNPMSSIEGANRGHRVDHVVRQIHPDDFQRFDLIIGMDSRNIEDLDDPWGKSAAAFCDMYDVIERTVPHLLDHLQGMHRDYRDLGGGKHRSA